MHVHKGMDDGVRLEYAFISRLATRGKAQAFNEGDDEHSDANRRCYAIPAHGKHSSSRPQT
jgi:hypothetical protein